MITRPTKYKKTPLQTQSMGSQQLTLPIDTLYEQSTWLSTARGIGLLIAGEQLTGNAVQQLLGKFQLSDQDLRDFPNSSAILPRMPKFDCRKLNALSKRFFDLASEDGEWRRHFEQTAPALIERKYIEVQSRLDALEQTMLRTYGFQPTIDTLAQLHQAWTRLIESQKVDWQASFNGRLRQIADLFQRHEQELAEIPNWKFWKKRMSKDVRSGLEKDFRSHVRIAEQRVKQLEAELLERLLARFLTADEKRSISSRIEALGPQCLQLRKIQERLIEAVQPITDSVSEVNVIQWTKEILNGGMQFHDLIEGAFAAVNRCPREVARRIQQGLRVSGTPIGPSQLATMEVRQAERILKQFADAFFEPAIEGVLRLDLSIPELRLPLVNALHRACSKAQPYLVFPHIDGVEQIREAYLHCHPAIRTVIETIRPSLVRFSNPANDSEFHIPQKHVLVLTCNTLGPGHARKQFAEGRYVRDKLLAEGSFASIYDFDQPLARPRFLAERPVSAKDSAQLFALGCEFGILSKRELPNGKTVVMIVPLDDTIRPLFETRIVKRKAMEPEHFVLLLDQPWFVDLVETIVPKLAPNWLAPLRAQMDRASALSIAKNMERIGILERKPEANEFRFLHPYRPGLPPRSELFSIETHLVHGFPEETFVRMLTNNDELYTRLLEDVVSAEASGIIPYRRLTEFAQHIVDQRSGRERRR